MGISFHKVAIHALQIVLICMLFTVGLNLSANETFKLTNTNETELDLLNTNIKSIMSKHRISGLSYAIVKNDHLPVVEVFGKADLKTNRDMNINTPTRIASISKIVVGIAAMQLIEQGKLAMNDRLDMLLPWLEYHNPHKDSQPILLAHLLENTTGWDEISLQEFNHENADSLSLQQQLSVNANSRRSRWVPGTRHAYTNSAATVVAAIVEKVSGDSFESYAQTNIFKALGITTASYQYDNKIMTTGSRSGQTVATKQLLMLPSGGLNISIADMAKLANEYVRDTPSILSKSSLERTEISTTTNAGAFDAGYGIYNYARYYNGFRYRGHDGALPGWLSEFSYSPKNQAGFVVFQNSENGRAFREIVNAIHEHISKGFSIRQVSDAQISNEIRDLSGYYRSINPRSQKRYFLERLVTSHRLIIQDQGTRFASVFPSGWNRELLFAGNGEWVNGKNETVMKLASDPLAGEVLHYGDRVFKKESVFWAAIDKIVLLIWLCLLSAFAAMTLIWLVKQRGKTKLCSIRIRQRKNVAGAVIIALIFCALLVLGLLSPIERLGGIGVISVGLFLTSIVIFAATIFSVIYHFHIQRKLKQKTLFVTGGIYLLSQLCVVLYLLNFGVVGMLSWT